MKKPQASSILIKPALLAAAATLALALALPATSAPQAGQPSPAVMKLLSVAEVESATGLKGVKVVPKNISKGAGGDLNFARADGTTVLAVVVAQGMYDSWKGESVLYNAPVSGIADEAFSGPAGTTPYVIYFRKGKQGVQVGTIANPADLKPLLTLDQLKAVAKIIASHL